MDWLSQIPGEPVEIGIKIALAALLAGLVGAEREWTGKWAGLRTHMLIAVGAALLTDVSVDIGPLHAAGSSAWDPARIAAQIVTGVGFLGAGTIIQSRGGVRGLTTAAGMWVAAAIGLAVGARFYAEAVITTAVLLLVLVALRPLERRLFHRDRRSVLVDLPPDRSLEDLAAAVERQGIQVDSWRVQESEGHRSVRVVLRGSEDDERRLLGELEERDLGARDDSD